MKSKRFRLVISALFACMMLLQPFAAVAADSSSTVESPAMQSGSGSTDASVSADTVSSTQDTSTSDSADVSGAASASASSAASNTEEAQSASASSSSSSEAQSTPASEENKKNEDDPTPLAAEPDIATDLVIDITQLSLDTPTITGTYDSGGVPGEYVPGKDFSATDDVSTGTEVDYSLGISLSSLSSTTYPIDKMYLEIVDPASPGKVKVFYLNTNPDPTIITDDGTNTLVPNYSMALDGLVFDAGAGITSTSTQKMPVTVTIPSSIIWKSKIMPQIRIVCERGSGVKKSDPFTLETVRFSSLGTLQNTLFVQPAEWLSFNYETTPQGTGFRLPFRINLQSIKPTTITQLGTKPDYQTLVYNVKIGAKLDGTTVPLTSDSFSIEISGSGADYTLQSKSYSNGVLTVVVKVPTNDPNPTLSELTVLGKVFVPYTKGSATQVTLNLDGTWDATAPGAGAEFTSFVNTYLFEEIVTGSFAQSRVISFVTPVLPVFLQETLRANYAPPDRMTQNLRISPNTFTTNSNIKFVRVIDSKNAGLPKATGMTISLYTGPTFTFVLTQDIAPALYTYQYAYVPLPAGYNPNTISQQVLDGLIPLDTYENVIAATGKRPNIMLGVLSGDATQGLPITAETTQQYDIISPTIIPIPGSEFEQIYNANPGADYTSYVYSYIALATNYTTVAQANAAYGNQLASVDQFVQRGNTVYVDLGTTKPPANGAVSRFARSSEVRADIPIPQYEAIMISGMYSDYNTPISSISDYTKEYLLTLYRRTLSPAGNGDALFKAGTEVTFPIDPAVAPYLYLSGAPYLRVFNFGTFTWTNIPATTFSYSGTSVKMTIPVDFVLRNNNSIIVPVKFIVPYATLSSSTETPQVNQDLYLSTFDGNSPVEGFPNTTPYFKTTYQNTAYRLLGGSVDTTGLIVVPQEYLGGTEVTYTSTVANISFPTNDYYVSMTVPTNEYNAKETSDNDKKAFITEITTLNPNTVLYYQTAAAATPQDIAQMKSLNGATNLQEFYNTRVVSGWTKFVPGASLPADVVMMVAFTPGVTNGGLARVDYKVRMDVGPEETTQYNNDSVVTYYSTQADLESQSNMVTIQNKAIGVVLVRYLEKGTGNVLAPQTQLKGFVGTPYSTTPKTIGGYVLDSDSGNTTGVFTLSTQTVTYYYTKILPDQGAVIVKYLEKDTGTVLAPQDTLTGDVGSPYTTTPKVIPGYTLNSDSGNTTGTFQSATQTVTYFYTKNAPEQGTVLVKYLQKGTGTVLAPQDTLTGDVGSPYTTTPKVIPGYTLDSDSGNTSGTFETTTQTVTYYYVQNPPEQGTVIVKYLEKDTGTVLAPQDTITGNVGDPYTTTPKVIPGYTLNSDSGNTSGTFTTAPQTVTYYYTKNPPEQGTVLVKFLEKDTGTVLAPQETLTGAVGSPYGTVPKAIPGYALDSDSGNTIGTFQSTQQTVTYYYVKCNPKQGVVIVTYLEKGTNVSVAPADGLTGAIGSAYTTTPKVVAGYTLNSDSGNTTGTFKDTPQTVTYYYTKNQPAQGTVIVKYLEKGTGAVLAPQDTLTGNVGSPYGTVPKNIAGYALDSDSGNTMGTFQTTPQTVTYYYVKCPARQGTVLVKYLEKGTNMVIAPATSLTGTIGSPYSTTPKTIAGYTLDSNSGNTTGTFQSIPQTVIYYYVKCAPTQGTVLVKYLEKGTNVAIAPQDTLTGAVGSPYTTTPKIIAGYTVDSNSGNTTGDFKTAPQTVIYYYVKTVPTQGTVLVKYLEKGTDQVLAPQDTLTGAIGSPYTTTPKTITGYTLDSNSGNTTGEFKSAPQTVIYYYVKAVPGQGTVTVNYLEKNTGKVLAPPDTLTGNVGAEYATSPKTIKGYTFVSDSGNTKGEFQTTPQTVNYYYTGSCPVPQTGDIILIIILSLLALSAIVMTVVWILKHRNRPCCGDPDDCSKNTK